MAVAALKNALKSRTRKRTSTSRRCQFESLERRELFAGDLIASAVLDSPPPEYDGPALFASAVNQVEVNELYRDQTAAGVASIDATTDLAFPGNGLARAAVAKDVIPGYEAIHRPEFANDGVSGNSSSWISDSAESWLKIDLGQTVMIDTVTFGRDRLGGYDDRDPGQFSIDVALADSYRDGDDNNDTAEYTRVFTSETAGFDGSINGAESLHARFAPVAARFVKLTVDNPGTAVDELQVFGSPLSASRGACFAPCPRVTIDPEVRHVVEDDNNERTAANFLIKVGPHTSPVSLRARTIDVGATFADNDYVPVDKIFHLAPSSVSATIPITVWIVGDSRPELNEALALIVQKVKASGFTPPIEARASITIENDDLPDLEFSDAQIVEGDKGTSLVAVTVTPSEPAAFPTSVRYRTSDGSAQANSDYEPILRATLMWAPFDTSPRTITVHVHGDPDQELDEHFFVEFFDAEGVRVPRGQARVTLSNDDSPPTIRFENPIVVEPAFGVSQATATVALSHRPLNDVVVHYRTLDGTARRADADYEPVPDGILTWSAADDKLSRQIKVNIKADDQDEADERFLVEFFGESGARLVNPSFDVLVKDAVSPFRMEDQTLTINGTSANDFGEVNTNGNGRHYVTLESQGLSKSFEFVVGNGPGQVGDLLFRGDAGDDRFVNKSGVPITIEGGDGNDSLSGGWANDRIHAGPGNDTVHGGSGNDLITGGEGDDLLEGDSGFDTMFGDGGHDRMSGGSEDDVMYGGDGADWITGQAGDDRVWAGNGNDVVYGDVGNDALYGENGIDSLFGQAGNDHLAGGSGNDSLYGGNDNDRMFGEYGDDIAEGGNGNDFMKGGEGNDRLEGQAGYDTMFGEDGNDWMYGGSEDDVMYGGNGADWITGQAGDDRVWAGNGNDIVYGDVGNDALYGENGVDSLFGQAGNDHLAGGAGNDSLYGGNDNDRLLGEDGNDFLDGGHGVNNIWGGAGFDQFRVIYRHWQDNILHDHDWISGEPVFWV